MKNLRDNLDDDKKNKERGKLRQRMKMVRKTYVAATSRAFEKALGIHPSDFRVLKTDGYRIMDEIFQSNRNIGPTNICAICLKLEFDHSGKKL